MITKVYLLNNCIACGMVLAEVAQRIPCFITFDDGDLDPTDFSCEVTIQCREADLRFVENSLSEFV